MARPEYEDAAAGGGYDPEPSTTQGDTTGWLQHGQDPDSIQTRGR